MLYTGVGCCGHRLRSWLSVHPRFQSSSGPWPTLPTATWLTGFPPCLWHELTSAPLTGQGGGGQGTSLPLCRVPTLPRPPGQWPRLSQQSQLVEGERTPELEEGRKGGPPGPLPALSPHLAWVSLAPLLPSWAALRGGEEAAFPPIQTLACPRKRDHVWLLLKAGDKGLMNEQPGCVAPQGYGSTCRSPPGPGPATA